MNIQLSLIVSMFIVIYNLSISHKVLAQKLTSDIYVDVKGGKAYSKVQFNRLSRESLKDASKKIIQLNKSKFGKFTRTEFIILVEQSLETVKKNWFGKKFPPFSLMSPDGITYNNINTDHKVMVLNFWSITCLPCIEEIPSLNKVTDQYKDRNVIFLAPTPEDVKQVMPIIKKLSFKYIPLLNARLLFKSLGIPGYPFHIVVARNGFVSYVQTGITNVDTGHKIVEAELAVAIDKALNQ